MSLQRQSIAAHLRILWKSVVLATVGLSFAVGTAAFAGEAKTQYFPLPTFRVGPYASSGIPVWGGVIDYFRYINDVEGGINGIKLNWEECETEWAVDKGIECYERMKGGKDGSPVPMFLPHGDPLSFALTDKSAADKIPLVMIAYGRTIAIDGRVFPYSFPTVFSYWSEASSVINFIAQKVGGKDKLKGLKIATVYHDSSYGKETQVPLAFLAKTYGFENIQIPVPPPGDDQSAQWAKVREIKPDWVFLVGWGVMTPVAIKTAAKVGYPVDHIIGGTWCASEADIRAAGPVAKGYMAITPFAAGTDFVILQKLKKDILDKGLSDLKDPKLFGTINYNAGVDEAIIAVEAIRTAQAHFGIHPINGVEGQWGLEHLDLSDKRLAEIGATGLEQPLKLSIMDHEGGGAGKAMQWDGQKWKVISGWIKSDRALLLPLIYKRAAAYAKERGIVPRDATN